MYDHDAPLADRIRACRLCADRFAVTATRHAPRPVVWFRPGTRILIVGQAIGFFAGDSFEACIQRRINARWTHLDARIKMIVRGSGQ